MGRFGRGHVYFAPYTVNSPFKKQGSRDDRKTFLHLDKSDDIIIPIGFWCTRTKAFIANLHQSCITRDHFRIVTQKQGGQLVVVGMVLARVVARLRVLILRNTRDGGAAG